MLLVVAAAAARVSDEPRGDDMMCCCAGSVVPTSSFPARYPIHAQRRGAGCGWLGLGKPREPVEMALGMGIVWGW